MEVSKIVAFKLGEEEYGLDITHVQSIERVAHITRVPNAPAYVKGVINLRGNVTPVIDLRSRLGMGSIQYSGTTRIIITKLDEMELGLIVDQTNDVIDMTPEKMEAAAGGYDSVFFKGIGKVDGRLIILLELKEILNRAN